MESVLRYELDEYGKVGITLESFNSLEEMDVFMQKFNDTNDVKNVYLDKINEFLKTPLATNYLKSIKEKENNGYVRGYTKDKYRLRLIPMIFKSTLLTEDKVYTKLRAKLMERKVLYDIYNRKFYILPANPTRFLKDELHRVVGHNGSNRIFIKEFINYIKSLNINERYYVLRVLCDKCDLLDEPRKKVDNLYKIHEKDGNYQLNKIKHYSFGDYSDEEITEMSREEEKPTTREGIDSDFEKLLSDFDIGYILENYDLDEIDRKTDYFDQMEKRGRKR